VKIKEIRAFEIDELKKRKSELAEELFRLKIRHATEKIDSTAMLSKLRKDIARVKTVLKEKEVAT